MIKELLFKAVDWIDLELKSGYQVDGEIRKEIGSFLLDLAKKAYREGDLEIVGSSYYQYSRILDHLPEDHLPIFLSANPGVDFLPLLIGLKEFNYKFFLSKKISFGGFYVQTIEDSLSKGKDESAYFYYNKIINSTYIEDIVYFSEISDFVLKQQLMALENDDFSLEKLNNFLDFYSEHQDRYWDSHFRKDLVKRLIKKPIAYM